MQLSVLFSPDKAHLVCAARSGRVDVWATEEVLRSASAGLALRPRPGTHWSFAAHDDAIYSLHFAVANGTPILVTGSDTNIAGWSWPAVLGAAERGAAPAPAFRLEHPRVAGTLGSVGALSECNDLAVDEKASALYTASGDGNAYAWDLATARLVQTFSGHEGYLHCVAARPYAGQVVTGSEDGTARLWDVRSAKSTATLRPPGESCGWCSCAQVDSTEDWLVCGWGAGVLTTWSLTAQTCTAAMPVGAAPQQLRFAAHAPSSVLSVGAEPHVYEWTLSGSLVQRVATASTSLFGVDSATGLSDGGLIAVCGNGSLVQLFDASLGTLRCELEAGE